ncbi:response regulator transcription factor [Paenibacillus agricola]|uniref:Response regulator n=1 Tax=Paenibacillus agricola TaxID=2716264 RepID=A0ABX0JE54_9BACL|nr:response regulator [Paenibacillus agricola]NHN32171.1 response regulator [Paenibacillus agricola]
MIKMIIVDDEPGQVNEMAAIIRHLRPDIQVFATTSAGKALEYAETHEADVIITDIRMPQMDGLELTEKIMQLNKDIMVVILSGYGEFQYAQKAIEFGVFEYLVKPISKAGLECLFTRIDGQMEKKHEELEGKQLLLKKLDTSVPVYLEHLLNKWVQHDVSINELNELLEAFPLAGSGAVFVTKIEKYKRLAGLFKPEEIASLQNHLKAKMKDVFQNDGGVISFLLESRNDLVVTVFSANNKLCLGLGNLERKLNELIEYTESELGLPLTMCISGNSDDMLQSVHHCYEQAVSALDYSFYSESGKCFFYPQLIVKAGQTEQFNVYELEKKLTNEVKNENIAQIYAIVNDTFDLLYSKKIFIKPNRLKEYFVYIALNMMKMTNISSLDSYYNELMEQVTEEINDCNNYIELRKTIKGIAEKLVGLRKSRDVNKNYVLIQKCKKYIEENYMEDISLETLAGIFYFNPSYLSNLFKTYAGISYSEYLTNVRIQKAQLLLKTSNEKVYTIACKVGYNDSAYLIKIFKRNVGVSPYKYRQLLVDQ